MARRSLSHRGHQSAARARGRAHGRAHHVFVRRRAPSQVRPAPAGPYQSDVLVRRGFRGGKLSASPGHLVRRTVRRQQLFVSHPRDGLFRSRGRLRRRAGTRLQEQRDPVLRGVVHQRLAVPDIRLALDCACAQRRRDPRVVRRDRDRQGPRCVPARGARAVHDRARLPRCGRQGARARGRKPMMLSRLNRDLTMAEAARGPGGGRVDLLLVSDMIEAGSRVLDVGCGDGELLRLLGNSRNVDGRGIELSREGVNECVGKGLAVVQGDADTDLVNYPDDAFDYVILSQTLQATRHPRQVLEHMLRIGRRAIVSFPNFGHWGIRLQIMFVGRMPTTDNLPYSWYDTPNIHFCTIKDFRALCGVVGARMERAIALNAWGRRLRLTAPWWFWNMFGEQAVFLLSRQKAANGRRGNG